MCNDKSYHTSEMMYAGYIGWLYWKACTLYCLDVLNWHCMNIPSLSVSYFYIFSIKKRFFYILRNVMSASSNLKNISVHLTSEVHTWNLIIKMHIKSYTLSPANKL